MHKCQNAQWDMLNSDANGKNVAKLFDLLLLQEPYLDYLGNPKATRSWKMIKPAVCSTHPNSRTRSIILVNTRIPTDCWEEIRIEEGNHDITAVQLKGDFGRLTLFNLYNDQNHSQTLRIIQNFITNNRDKIQVHANDFIYLGGDFNRHHPMWENDANTQLLTARHLEKAQQTIDLITNLELEQSLPKGIPTFYSHAHNSWTRPDNVFCSETLTPSIVVCDVDKDFMTGPGIDHMPITTTLDLNLLHTRRKPRYDFKNVDWEKFNTKLQNKLATSRIPQQIQDEDSFHLSVNELTHVIQDTMKDEVKRSKPFPLSKRWWSKDLSKRKKEIRKLAAEHFKFRALPDHPSHTNYKRENRKYSNEIKKQKARHWEEYLTNALDEDTPSINFFISEPPTDGSSASIPTLKSKNADGTTHEATTNDEKAKMLSQAFFPPKPADTHIPTDYPYPEPIRYTCIITKARVTAQIDKLKPYKAPGPDEIPNIIWKRCSDLLVPHLTRIFRATFRLNTYSPSWKEWTTIVLKKPGKPRYDTAKAWRPIALMNTMGKILTALVAEDLTYMCEKHQLLPKNHFGGRPGRTTTDAIHLMLHKIKAAWRKGKVVSILFLDIEGAFPNAVLDRLLHNMKKRRIPEAYIQFTKRQLENRRTKLSFDDFTSEWIPIDNGTGQGDPASMFDYLLYNADLIDEEERALACAETTAPIENSARERGTQRTDEDAAAYVDDTWLMAIGDSFDESNATLKDMMERKGGALDWSLSHNSKFELTKTMLMCFTKRREPCPSRRGKTKPLDRPSLNIRGTLIKPSPSCRYLGIIIDEELKWKEQSKAAIGKATKWTLAFRRMAQPSKGLKAKLMLKLYKTVLVPKITYGIDTWYQPTGRSVNSKRRTGSVAALKQFTKIQRMAAIAITGALKTTATDVLEVHAGILPMELTLAKNCHRAAVRLATLPDSHPLYKPIQQSARKVVKRHPGPLHHILALLPCRPSEIETIQPIRQRPSHVPPAKIHIADSRDKSKEEEEKDKAEAKIYTDGSAYEGGVGASAVMYVHNRPPKILKYLLGPASNYTVANAEAVGTCLAAHLLKKYNGIFPSTITIYVDSQATIKGLSIKRPKPGQYLIDEFLVQLKKLTKDNPETKIKICWISAHDGVEGNEKADEAAKEAAQGNSTQDKHLPPLFRNKTLPYSASAIKQTLNEEIKVNWSKSWEASPRHRRLKKYDKHLPYSKFIQNTQKFPRKHVSILTQLRTGHIPLYNHLYRINKVDAPRCPTCESATETTSHYILECPTHKRERFLLRLRAGRNSRNLQYLLGTTEGMKHTMKYVQQTGRFKRTYGDMNSTENNTSNEEPDP